jgi:hypothetical protein
MSDPVTFIRYRMDGSERIAKGRCAWALSRLIAAGAEGCTPITEPGPRWSEYVRRLRGDGVQIETITETHGGAYRGHHAVYVLRSPVEIIETKEAA